MSLRYDPALDGLRGLSILLVFLFHFGWLPFGWIGVQIFFVLSGYLITTILLGDRELPLQQYLLGFYWRRTLRIFPLYFAYVAIAAGAYLLFGEPGYFPNDAGFLLTYTANFARFRAVDLGAVFVHLWSLAVEEQFYLFWPILCRLPHHQFRAVVIGCIACAPLARFGISFLVAEPVIGRAVYSAPVSHFDAFAIGAAIAIWRPVLVPYARILFYGAGVLAAIAGATVVLHQHFLSGGAFKGALGWQMYLLPLHGYVWGYTLINLTAGALLLCVLERKAEFSWTQWRPLVGVGIVSYGIYVLHVPVLAVLEHQFNALSVPRPLIFAISAGIVGAAAALSYRYFEAPLLRFKNRPPLDYLAPRKF